MSSYEKYMEMANKADEAGEEEDARDLVALARQAKSSQSLDQDKSVSEYKEPNLVDAIAGNPVYRAVQGVADLPFGAAQFIANKTGVGEDTMNSFMGRRDEMMNEGRKQYGDEGMDLWRMGGNVAGGGVAGKGIQLGTGVAQQVGRGIATGAGFGAITPVGEGDYWDKSIENTKIGATLGGLIPGATNAVKGAYGSVVKPLADKFGPIFESTNKSISKILRGSVPESRRGELSAALRDNKSPVSQGTAGEVASDVRLPEFSAIARTAEESRPNQTFAVREAQAESRQAILDRIAGNADDLSNAKTKRKVVSDILRENAYENAASNTDEYLGAAGRVGALSGGASPDGGVRSVADAVRLRSGTEDEVSKAIAASKNQSTVWGAKIPAKYTPHRNMIETADEFVNDAKFIEEAKKFDLDEAEALVSSMDAYGIKPLTVGSVNKRLQLVVDNPETAGAAKTIIKKIMKGIESEAEDGLIDPVRLYRMRKLDLQQTAERLFGKDGASQYQAALVRDAQKAIDDAMESASGGGWKTYLKAYSELSRPIEKLQVGQQIRSTLYPEGSDMIQGAAERSTALSKSLRDQSTVKRATGDSTRQVSDIIPENDMLDLKDLRSDLLRSKNYDTLSKQGGRPNIDMESAQLPNALWREVMITNNVLRGLGETKQKKVMDKIGELMFADSGKGFGELADLIDSLPPENRNKVLKLIAEKAPNISAVIGATTTGEANATQR